jgi:two-component sensor histidine kinase
LRLLGDARSIAAAQQDALRQRLQWLNTAQVTVVTPMAIICFALAFLAWMNLRTLQQSWEREREVRGHLEVAVQESNHRIKYNLQVIAALIDMQIQEPGTMVSKNSLEDIVHQVRAVAAVHDFFSHELKSDQIRTDEMLQRLVDLSASPIGLRVDLQAEAIALAVKQATAVALITNELLLNSGKHGATKAQIVMKLSDSTVRLQVSDNGPGFPSGFDASQNANLGLTLVDTLVRHDLQGEVLFGNEDGARVDVMFPLVPAEQRGSL